MHVSADDLVAALRNRGLRITGPRRSVCAILADGHGEHLTAADIHQRVEGAEGRSIDQSTVYRTIDTLEETGLLTHTHLGHGSLVYHLSDEAPHQHLMCRRCSRSMGMPATELEPFYTEIARLTGFVVDPTHGVIWGLCADCGAEG